MKWTSKKTIEIKQLLGRNKTRRFIAKSMGIGRSAIQEKIQRIERHRSPLNNAEFNQRYNNFLERRAANAE